MRKILIAGILVAIILASIGLVTASYGFGPSDVAGESDNVYDGEGCGPGDGTCDGEGTGECEGNCKQNGEGNGICTGECDGEQNKYQYGKGKCYKNQKTNGCCRTT